MKEFNPTHIYHYPDGSNCKEMFPNGVPVVKGHTIKGLGIIEWLSDSEGNVAGYSVEGEDRVVSI